MHNTTYHVHHIVPKHMGGTDDKSNLKFLSIKDHANAHKLLFEKYNQKFDYSAWKSLEGLCRTICTDFILISNSKNFVLLGNPYPKTRKYPVYIKTKSKNKIKQHRYFKKKPKWQTIKNPAYLD